MTLPNETSSDGFSSELTGESEFSESLMPGFNLVLKTNHKVRALTFEYTLAAAILGLLPIYGNRWIDTFGFIALMLLNLKMIHGIRAYWGNPDRQDVFVLATSIIGVLGAFGIAILARLFISTIGLFIPFVVVFGRAIGHALLTWILGRVTNQFCLTMKQVDLQTIRQILKATHRS